MMNQRFQCSQRNDKNPPVFTTIILYFTMNNTDVQICDKSIRLDTLKYFDSEDVRC